MFKISRKFQSQIQPGKWKKRPNYNMGKETPNKKEKAEMFKKIPGQAEAT